ncbi:MAG: hypothetical protein IPF99_35675 [Deltaproteobacteria bacterium]|nr:hypothetical protein [Deltaproteobacteria bacterium]
MLGLSTVEEIATCGSATCARLGNGTVRCWGDNSYGQLGDGTTTSRPTPTSVTGLSDVVEIAAGVRHFCARLLGGTLNGYGQLGDGTMTTRLTPTAVAGISGAAEITAADNHSCARLTDGTTRCWGNNLVGQLGDGTLSVRPTPSGVLGLSAVVEIVAAGYGRAPGDSIPYRTCSRQRNGDVRCWGGNGYGQLGDGTSVNRSVPVLVSDL